MFTKEWQEQVTLHEWVKATTDLPFIYIPNDGQRSRFRGSIMKRMGLYPGCCDIFIPRPNKTFHGLFIELKTKQGKPTASQIEFISRMITEGYGAFICYGADEAILIIKQFYGI